MSIYEQGERVELRGLVDFELPDDGRSLPTGLPFEVAVIAVVGEDDQIEWLEDVEFRHY